MSCPGAGKVLLGLAIGALAVPASVRAADLLAVRHWSAPDHTRIVIDLSEGAPYLHRVLEDPPRVAVDIDGGRFRFPTTDVPIDDGIVRRIRFNVLAQSGKAQVVLDLDRETRYDVFALERYQDKPDRIVIDVKKAISAVPIPPPAPETPRVEQIIGPDNFGDFLIMIDPGHGGEDTGRRNPDGLKEKNLALDFAEALAAEINSRRGYRAELTRTGDYFVSLARRRELAEERGAHLFVSIHFNAAPATSARGTEVFFVSLTGADSRVTRELEAAENSADLVGGVPPTDRETESQLARMLVSLRQNDSVERSQKLATLVTDHVGKLRGIESRKVKQAGFAVLKSLFIPAILVEVAFLTNRDDERFIRSSANRARYVAALADGIEEYVDDVEVPRLGWRIHTVHRGETLSEIASSYAMNIQDLRGANGIPGDQIYPGQKLRVRPR